MAAPNHYYPSPISRAQSNTESVQQRGNSFNTGYRQPSGNIESHILPASPGTVEMGAPMQSIHLETSASVFKTPYAEKCKELLSITQNLKDLSVSSSIDLPKITVVGSKNSGKSSLIEAISGINLPRNGGTRCPVIYHISPSLSGWSADISLHIQEDDFGLEAPQLRIYDLTTVPSSEQLPDMISHAQTIILSPHMHGRIGDFKKMNSIQLDRALRSSQQLRYSASTIHVYIKDPFATGFTFVDLPGLPSEGEQTDINMVKDLVKDHIAGGNVLILVVVPMDEALHHQEALALAHAADEQAERTLVVLTKPDILASSDTVAQSTWESSIESNPKAFHCVKLLDDGQRFQGISRNAAEKLAQEFFRQSPPWDGLVDCLQIGVRPLVSENSRRLAHMLEQTVPEMRAKVRRLLDEHKLQLGKVPSTFSDQHSTEVSLRIDNFCQQLRLALDGDDFEHPVDSNKQAYEQFKVAICRTVPNFYPFPRNSTVPDQFPPPPGDLIPILNPINLEETTSALNKATGYQLAGHIPFSAIRGTIVRYTKLWERPAEQCLHHVLKNVTELVKTLIKEHFGPFEQLRTQLGDTIFQTLESCKEDTELSLRKALDAETKLRRLLTNNTEDFDSEDRKWFRHYADAYIRSTLGNAAIAPAQQGSNKKAPGEDALQSGSANPLGGDDEQNTEPIIPRDQGSGKSKNPGGSGPSDAAQRAKNGPPLFGNEEGEHSKPQKKSKKKATEGDGDDPHPARSATVRVVDDLSLEHYKELVIMAKSRAYFQIAHKRVIDNIPLAIEHDLCLALTEGLRKDLFEHLNTDSQSMMESFVPDHGGAVQERTRLQDRIERLDRVLKRLDMLNEGIG